MASLRTIMNNVEEDSLPRRAPGSSTPKPVPTTSSLPSSSYPASSDRSSNNPSPSNYSRGASPHSIYSHTSESSAPRHSHQQLSLPPARRGSGSNDPMAYSYSQSCNANHDKRPVMPSNAMGDASVKLTPITGRVSRAKKGVPVHTCDLCRPPKTFTRAEHLRRHQLSHQPPELACSVPGCSKVFHRKDLLERHQQRHEQDERLAAAGQPPLNSPPRRQSQSFGSSSPSPAMQMGSYSTANPSNTTLSSTPRHDASGPSHWTSASRSFGHTLPPPRISTSPQHYYAHSPQSRYSADSTQGSQTGSPAAECIHHGATTEHKTPEAGHDFYMSDGDQSNSPGMPYSASGSTFSTASDSSNEHSKRARSSSTEWTSAPTRFVTSPKLRGSFNPDRTATANYDHGFDNSVTVVSLVKETMTSSIHIPGYEDEFMMSANPFTPNTTILALRMPFGAGRSSDTLMAVPSTAFHERMMTPQSPVSPPPIAMLDNGTAQGVPILALSQLVRQAVPVYLEVYWNRVHPMYPIIHRPTFEKSIETMNEDSDILQCVMAAVATQFLGHEDHRINGSQLHFHAACKLEVVSCATNWPLQTMQAMVLSEYYMRFRGREKDAYETSPVFSALYQKAYQQAALPPKEAEFCRPSTWTEWVEDEAQRRILSSCFLLDIHCMRYFERAPVSVPGLDYSSPGTLNIPLSTNTTQLWEANTLDAWSKLNPQCPRVSVGDAITQGFNATDIQESSRFDASVLLAAYSLQFPTRQNPTRVDLIQDVSGIDLSHTNVLNLFACSAVANTYLALHFAPLHIILSVSGDSWVFNKKVLRLTAFTEHQGQLSRWRDSNSSAAAAAFAARALVAFLGVESADDDDDSSTASLPPSPAFPCSDISDFWGIYVCALICWSFGHVAREEGATTTWSCNDESSSRPAALQWLRSAAKLQPAQVQRLAGRRNAQAVVGLTREALEREYFGGRSILIADAVGVLRKLEGGGRCKRF